MCPKMADLAVAWRRSQSLLWDLERDLERDFLANEGEGVENESRWWQLKNSLEILSPKIGEDEPILTSAYFSKGWEKKHQVEKEGFWFLSPFSFGGGEFHII